MDMSRGTAVKLFGRFGPLSYHPPTPLFEAKNRFSELTFSFFVSIFLACLTAVAGVKRFVLLFSGRLYCSKID